MSPSPDKIERQIIKAGLPKGGQVPFEPQLAYNAHGELEIVKRRPQHGPKWRKKGYVDVHGQIWIKEHAHSGHPDHWDVQIDDGRDYIRVDLHGNRL